LGGNVRGSVAELWHAASEEEKIKYLQCWATYGQSVDTDLLDEEVEVLDKLGESLGLVKVWCTKVDVAGMRDYAPGLVSSEVASQYRKRGK